MSASSLWRRTPDPLRAVAAAEHALSEERRLLFSGDLPAVVEVADRRVAEISALERLLAAEPAHPERLAEGLRKFRARAERHAKLLEAAMSGAQAARRKLKAIDDARTTLPGYDASGAPRARSVSQGLGRKA
ncbi:hypothetical protein [Rubrimonas cliftonensis]|uniref:FlgN protein n=1 Tax=Rubrimonas cliftonensis TaxID=89524 RepID=A0A1H4C7E9_9RHOB|nr:hypothetical protein [Rubrimonas cliftonensis]SEA56276.1 hypothetical protein SAMN05444370_106244 [Rubrimonas cliftonensis]